MGCAFVLRKYLKYMCAFIPAPVHSAPRHQSRTGTGRSIAASQGRTSWRELWAPPCRRSTLLCVCKTQHMIRTRSKATQAGKKCRCVCLHTCRWSRLCFSSGCCLRVEAARWSRHGQMTTPWTRIRPGGTERGRNREMLREVKKRKCQKNPQD